MEEDERGKKYSLFSISGFELFQTEVVEQISSNCCSNVLLTMTNNNHCCFNYLDWNNPTKSYFHFYLWENYGLYLCRSVTCARNKSAHIWRKREGHDIASVACIRCALLSRFDVPKRTKKNKERLQWHDYKCSEAFCWIKVLTKSCHHCLLRFGCHQGTDNNLGIPCDLAAPGWPAHSLHGSLNCKKKII